MKYVHYKMGIVNQISTPVFSKGGFYKKTSLSNVANLEIATLMAVKNHIQPVNI